MRTSALWVERSWRGGDITSADGRRALWGEVVDNGWAGMLEPSFDGATVLDATLLVESLAYGGCSLPLVGAGLIAPLVASLAGIDPAGNGGPDGGGGNLALLAFEAAGASPPTARGLEIADLVVAVRWSAHPAGGDPTRRWEVATVAADAGSGLVAHQTEDRFVLSSFADPGVLDAARWQPVDGAAMERLWRIGAVLSAAELVGLGRTVLDQCVEYAGVRVQGGKPIGGHQAVQHRLADMLAEVDRSRYLTYLAASLSPTGPPAEISAATPADEAVVHQAKALAARDCVSAIRAAHQVLGAISFSAEHELHHLHKQALLAANEFGSANHHWRALERAPA